MAPVVNPALRVRVAKAIFAKHFSRKAPRRIDISPDGWLGPLTDAALAAVLEYATSDEAVERATDEYHDPMNGLDWRPRMRAAIRAALGEGA